MAASIIVLESAFYLEFFPPEDTWPPRLTDSPAHGWKRDPIRVMSV